MKVVVGLGNPGKRYEGTRHNIGFKIVAELCRRHAAGVRPRAKFDGELTDTTIGGAATCLVTPLTYMNVSGRCVRQIVDFYKLNVEDLLIVCDEFQLPLAKLRFRPGGSHGGQNGLEDILTQLGTTQVPRLRFGIGPLKPGWDPADFVLSRFDAAEQSILDDGIARAADGVEAWIAQGMSASMNQFNGGPTGSPDDA